MFELLFGISFVLHIAHALHVPELLEWIGKQVCNFSPELCEEIEEIIDDEMEIVDTAKGLPQ